MNLKSRPIIQGAIGVFLGTIVLYLLFQRISPLVLLDEIASANWMKLAWAALFIGLSYVFRSALWRALMHQFHSYSYGAVFRSTMIGYLLNNILPARLGDVSRGMALYVACGGNTGFIFGSLALERILDVSILIGSLGILLVYLNLHYTWLARSIIILGSLVIAFFIIAAILKWLIKSNLSFPSLIKKWISRSTWLENSAAFVINLGNSMSLKNASRGILWLLITWFITFWGLYFVFDSLNLTLNIGLFQIVLILGIASLGLAIPSLPASLGTYQAAFIFGARLVGLQDTDAVSASFLYQGLWVIITSVLGLISIAWAGISLKRLFPSVMNQKKDVASPQLISR